VLYDGREPGALGRAEQVSGAILDLCVKRGGSITGEHGVGVDKAAKLPLMFTPEDLATMRLLRDAFDPDGRANPGKVFPTPRRCGERAAPGQRAPSDLGTGDIGAAA
jgi:glycolate oxidase